MQQHAGRVFSRAVVLSLGSVSQFQGLCESVPELFESVPGAL